MSSNYSFRQLELLWNSLAYYMDDSWATKLEYYCFPKKPESSLTEPVWKILRMETDKTTGDMIQGKAIKFAWGTPDFEFPATDLSVVAALSYL